MISSTDFVDNLLNEMQAIRDQDTHTVTEDAQSLLPEFIIKHWLNFAVYYERAAVSFIGGWLRNVKDEEALHHFSHQIEDECNHFRWLKKHLQHYGGDYSTFNAPREWSFLMESYYPRLDNVIEQLAAHNLAAETGVLGFMSFSFHRFPEEIKKTLTTVIKDETYHVSFACKLLRKYCTTQKLQDLARRSALESLEYMQKAREVFVNPQVEVVQ